MKVAAVLVAACVACAVSMPTDKQGVFFTPLIRVESNREKYTRLGQLDKIVKGVHRPYILASPGYEPESDYNDLSYLANVTLGTPAQSFIMVMDTGSANLWVPDSSCNFGGCQGKDKFRSTASSTYKKNGKTFSIQYGTGSCSGILGEDNFCFSSTPALCDNVVFGQATHMAAFFAQQTMDGICGMAFQRLAVDGVTPPFIKMVQDGVVANSYFTVWMTADGGQSTGKIGGGITYGGMDSQHCSASVSWVPLSSATYFEFKMSGGSINGQSFTATNGIADTGTSLLAGPTSAVETIGKALNAKYSIEQGLYYVSSCTGSYPDIQFMINGQTFGVSSKNYLLDLGDGRCYIGLQAMEGGVFGPQWILGDVFLREYCGVFDVGQQRVGFAKATA